MKYVACIESRDRHTPAEVKELSIDPVSEDAEQLAIKQAQQMFIGVAEDRDWHYTDLDYDDNWPDVKLYLVQSEVIVPVKEVVTEKQKERDARYKEMQENNERRQYENLKRKFEAK